MRYEGAELRGSMRRGEGGGVKEKGVRDDGVGVRAEGRGGGSELGSNLDLDLDPAK